MANIQIIGAGGFLGKNIFRYLSEQQHNVLGTSHQKKLIDSPKVSFLDLLNPDFIFLQSSASSLQFSIICSGETNIDKCKTEIEMSETLNVTHTIQLIKNLWTNKITPVFISSDAVFDGQTGNYVENDICNPATQYGIQKRCVEKFLIASNKPWLIIRLCKVFDVGFKDRTLLTNWLDSLRAGQSIKCASDQLISPTYILDVCKAIENIITKGKTGIYHACSPEIFSRFDLGLKVAKYFQIDPKKVGRCSIFDFSFIEPRSCHSTLSPKKLTTDLGFNFSTMVTCFEKISINYEQQNRT
jgi:dTDP-4-dehydrorhamnose reductase